MEMCESMATIKAEKCALERWSIFTLSGILFELKKINKKVSLFKNLGNF